MSKDWNTIEFLKSIQKISNTKKIPKKDFLNIGNYPIISQEDDFINGFWNNENDVFNVDKPVVIFGDHTKKLKFINFSFVIGADGIKILLPIEKIDSKFYYYQLQSLQIKDLGYARHYRLLKEFNIKYPEIDEQKQIVEILDKAFEAIDKAKANLEKNIQNLKELFQSRLNEIFSQKGEGWEEKTLDDLSYLKSGGTPLKSKNEYWNNGNIPWYSSGELNDLLTIESNNYITNIGLNNSNAKLFPKGSLLIGMYDTAALKMSILHQEATFNQAIAGMEPRDGLNLEFVLHAINAKKQDLLNERRGVRQKNLSLTKIKSILINIPKIEKQNKIVEEVNEFFNKTKQLEKKYQQKLQNLAELKKSILQKAFSGELV